MPNDTFGFSKSGVCGPVEIGGKSVGSENRY